MGDEKLKFMDMLAMINVIDDNDRIRNFKDCIERSFDEANYVKANIADAKNLLILSDF